MLIFPSHLGLCQSFYSALLFLIFSLNLPSLTISLWSEQLTNLILLIVLVSLAPQDPFDRFLPIKLDVVGTNAQYCLERSLIIV